MENASKALIIAGAVLVAIIIITLGVQIISSQKGTIDQSEQLADTMTVKTYNTTFEKYAGIKKGSEVTNLLTDIRTNNNMSDVGNTITVKYSGEADTINNITAKVIPIKNYRIDIDDYSTQGLVSVINIIPQ